MKLKTCLLAFLAALCCYLIPSPASASATCYNTQPVLAWNGSTDDTAALITAINTALAQAGNGAACVQLPVGTGVLCQVELPSAPNGLTIQGYGIGSTTIKPCSATTKIFSTALREMRYLDIGKFSIMSNRNHTSGSYFDLRNVFGIFIHDIRADRGWNFANIEDSYELHVCQTDIRNFKGTVFTINGGNEFRWCSANNYDDDTWQTSQASSYLLVRKGGGITLGGVDAIHCGSCYVFNPTEPGASIEWVFASQTMADSCSGHGWVLNAAAGTTIKGFQGMGIWSASCSGSGFLVTGAGTIDGISLLGPRLQANGQDGASVQSGNNIDIADPVVAGNSASNPGTYSGLSFGGTANSFTVNGGHVGTMLGYGNSQLRNIVVHPQITGLKTFAILGVNLCGFASGGASFLDASTGAAKMVRNNLCFNSTD